MATPTPLPLGQGVAGLTGSPTTIFVVPAGATYVPRSITYCNTSGSRRTIRVCKVPNGSAFGEATAVAWDAPVDPGWPVVDDSIHVFGQGDSLQISADEADAVTLTADGASE